MQNVACFIALAQSGALIPAVNWAKLPFINEKHFRAALLPFKGAPVVAQFLEELNCGSLRQKAVHLAQRPSIEYLAPTL